MTPEEIQEYNKLCAEFLGWKYQSNPLERWYGQWFHVQREERLYFDSDWNWIHEVKASICNSPKVDEFNTHYDSVAKGYHCSILPVYKNSFDGFYTKVFNTEKEAVVEAIYQFLKWYKT